MKVAKEMEKGKTLASNPRKLRKLKRKKSKSSKSEKKKKSTSSPTPVPTGCDPADVKLLDYPQWQRVHQI